VSRRASRSTWKAVPGICTAGIWLLCKRRRCKYPATLLCTGSGGMTDRSTSTHIAQRVRSVYSSDQSRMNWISTEIGQSGRPKRTLWLAPRSPPSRPLPRRHHPGDIAITQHSCTRHSFPVPCRAVLCCAVYMCLLPPSHQAEHHRAFFLFIFPSRGTPRASGPYTRYCSYVHAILGTLASEGRDDGNTKNHSRTGGDTSLPSRFTSTRLSRSNSIVYRANPRNPTNNPSTPTRKVQLKESRVFPFVKPASIIEFRPVTHPKSIAPLSRSPPLPRHRAAVKQNPSLLVPTCFCRCIRIYVIGPPHKGTKRHNCLLEFISPAFTEASTKHLALSDSAGTNFRMSTRVLLRPWLVPVCRQCSRQSVPSSTRRLYSSEISTTEPSASRPNNGAAGRTTDGAFDHGLDEHTFPIGSSNLSKESTNTETRSDSSGTGIGCISRYANNWTEGGARHPRNGTVDRSLGIGGRILDASRPAQAGMRRSGQGLRSMSTIPHTKKGDTCMSILLFGTHFGGGGRAVLHCFLCLISGPALFQELPYCCLDGVDCWVAALYYMPPMNCCY
jgi:hypothetical protein